MKRNASLVLLELVIMLLVFSVAAAMCVRAFAWADEHSRLSANEDMALLQAQNAAQALKAACGDYAQAARCCGGQWDKIWQIHYDEAWCMVPSEAAFLLQVQPVDSENALLGKARLTVTDPEGTVLAELTVCWQEGTS